MRPETSHAFPSLLLFLFGSVLIVLSSCSDSGDFQSFTGTRWDSAGIEIVEHPAVGEYHGPLFQVDYLLTVSDTLASGAGEFGKVADADLLPDGTLAVLDEFAAEVRVFSSEGDLVRRIGRKGQGPGELSGNWTLGILPISSGRLALPDVVNQTIVVFDAEGSHHTNIHWDVMEETIPQWRSVSGDTVLVLVTTEETNSFVRRTLDGGWRDTVTVADNPDQAAPPTDGRTQVFTNHVLWSASGHPQLLAVSQMDSPRLSLFEGKTLRRIIRWSSPNQELSEGDRDILLRVVARAVGDPQGEPEAALQYFTPPEHAPAVADIELGPGIVMVQRLRPFGEMDQRILSTIGAEGYGGPLWDVFTWSGEYLGVLDFGENVEVFRVHGDTVVGIREDSLAVVHPFLARLVALRAQ